MSGLHISAGPNTPHRLPGEPMVFTAEASSVPITACIGGTLHGGIGDVTSKARGSGARFNDGKPDLSLLPLTMLAEAFLRVRPDSTAAKALYRLGCYQQTQDIFWLYDALEVLGADGWEECAHVFTYGKRKYAAWNWAKGMPWSVPLACAARHLLWMLADFASLDNESQLPHRGHVFCNVVMLLQYAKTYTEGNDLPPKGML